MDKGPGVRPRIPLRAVEGLSATAPRAPDQAIAPRACRRLTLRAHSRHPLLFLSHQLSAISSALLRRSSHLVVRVIASIESVAINAPACRSSLRSLGYFGGGGSPAAGRRYARDAIDAPCAPRHQPSALLRSHMPSATHHSALITQ